MKKAVFYSKPAIQILILFVLMFCIANFLNLTFGYSTVYSNDFDKTKFTKLKNGDNLEHVISQLGLPLRISPKTTQSIRIVNMKKEEFIELAQKYLGSIWHYSFQGDGKLNWNHYYIEFDSENNISKINIKYITD